MVVPVKYYTTYLLDKKHGYQKGNTDVLTTSSNREFADFKLLVQLLKKYTSSKGKISSTRMTGVKNKQKQRKLRLAIMHARYLGLLPYVLY